MRSPVEAPFESLAQKKAMRSPNSGLYGLRANIAPVDGSTSVTMCIVDFGRKSPRTHSMYPVAESLRIFAELLRTLRTENLIDASMAT